MALTCSSVKAGLARQAGGRTGDGLVVAGGARHAGSGCEIGVVGKDWHLYVPGLVVVGKVPGHGAAG